VVAINNKSKAAVNCRKNSHYHTDLIVIGWTIDLTAANGTLRHRKSPAENRSDYRHKLSNVS
jgi:hypothetical protein